MKTFIALILGTTLVYALKTTESQKPHITSTPTSDLPHVKHKAFQVGEKLRYRVTYGFMDAGEATLELKSTTKKGDGRELIHAVGIGKTLGGFNTFYRVFDKYETFFDKSGVFPWFFKRRVDEGGYKISQDYSFKQADNKVVTDKGKTFKIPSGTQDMISAFYYARTLDLSNIKKGETFEFKVFMDDEVFNLKIRYLGTENISVRKGTFKCFKFGPVMQKGRYFKKEEDVNFWITADDNRIPVLVKANIPVGSVKLQLVEWSGLRNPLSSKVK